MAYRKDVHIKTNYQTKADCIEELVDHKKKTFFALFLRQISGLMTDEGEFEISSRFNAGAFFEYKGRVVEETDGIYLKGHMAVKRSMKIFIIILAILLIPASPVYIFAWGFWGILFMVFMFIDVAVIFGCFKYSDALYKDVMRKLS